MTKCEICKKREAVPQEEFDPCCNVCLVWIYYDEMNDNYEFARDNKKKGLAIVEKLTEDEKNLFRNTYGGKGSLPYKSIARRFKI